MQVTFKAHKLFPKDTHTKAVTFRAVSRLPPLQADLKYFPHVNVLSPYGTRTCASCKKSCICI